MSDLRELYQEVILDHNKNPRNFKALDDATNHADGYNPLCGDKLAVWVKVKEGVVEDVAFKGTGCAISMASASMMTQTIKGKSVADARKLFEAFHDLVTGKETAVDAAEIGKLEVFSGVSEFPVRVKCATLAWHTLNAAVDGKQDTVSTE
jgi:nitrogen fixation protein NifU and related proteins